MRRTHCFSHPTRVTWNSLRSWWIKYVVLKYIKTLFSLPPLIFPATIIALYFKQSHSSLLNHPNCKGVQKKESLLLCSLYTPVVIFMLLPISHCGFHDICNVRQIREKYSKVSNYSCFTKGLIGKIETESPLCQAKCDRSYSLSVIFLNVNSMRSGLFLLFYAFLSPQHIEHCLVHGKRQILL